MLILTMSSTTPAARASGGAGLGVAGGLGGGYSSSYESSYLSGAGGAEGYGVG
ncbi:unnamed protein product, partial [Rotaria sp. Silwood1]